MKRVVFGYDGGFPLEQETLIQIQAAYEEDMLEALFTLWGLSTKERYKINIPESSSDEDGWLIMPKEILLRGIGKEDSSSDSDNDSEENDDVKVTKLQLIRVSYFTGGQSVLIEDKRLSDGKLPYSEGTINKVYEEFVGKLVADNTQNSLKLSTFKPLTSISEIDEKADNNTTQINAIKEDYLPRDGSKPMTGDLDLGSDNDLIFKKVNSSSIDYISYEDSNLTGKPNIPPPGVFDFVANQAKGEKGNAWIRSGGVITNKLGVGVTQPSKSLEVNANNDSVKLDNLAEVNSQTPLVIDSQGNVGKNTNGITSANFIPGMIMMWSGNVDNVPTGWILCDGNGGTQINGLIIPDLRGRFVIGFSRNSSTSPTNNPSKTAENYGRIHNKGGLRDVALSSSEIPAHNHKMKLTSGAFFPTKTRNPGGSGEGGRRTMDEVQDNSAFTDNNTGGGQSHENRPPYYVLAFIMYVGEFNQNPLARITYADGSTAQKSETVPLGETFIVGLDATTSSDPDGDDIVKYYWWKCFEQDDWVEIGNNTSGILNFEIPSGRYGLHYFGVQVEDSQGNKSKWPPEDNGIKYRINRPIIITPPTESFITVTPSDVTFLPTNNPDVYSSNIFTINASPGWRVSQNFSDITVNPSSSSTSGQRSVTLTARLSDGNAPIGQITFETTDGKKSVQLKWEGLCFDLESDILMASGQSKKLKNIVIGDEVRVYNFTNPLSSINQESSLLTDLMKGATKGTSKVVDFGTQTVEEYRKITLVNGKILNVTASHPILASKDNNEVSWLLPDDLRGGYFVVDDNGKLVEIESKRTVKSSLDIGVLQLENGDNYFVNDVMVHNANIIRAVAREVNNILPQPIDTINDKVIKIV
ncbi:hypothetical protein [Tenacibaculum sp. 190524A05c]|uniref:HintN domain-containing protein n=1 Tax=Tenacibaculum platacis TaxID=3137852 RepID=A0ABM9P5J1_9FLAO